MNPVALDCDARWFVFTNRYKTANRNKLAAFRAVATGERTSENSNAYAGIEDR
jgi:hypothetical protein